MGSVKWRLVLLIWCLWWMHQELYVLTRWLQDGLLQLMIDTRHSNNNVIRLTCYGNIREIFPKLVIWKIWSWILYTAGDLQGEFIFESYSEENPIALLKSISVHKNFIFQTVQKYLLRQVTVRRQTHASMPSTLANAQIGDIEWAGEVLYLTLCKKDAPVEQRVKPDARREYCAA